MTTEQLNQLTNIESQLISLLASLPKNEIARSLSTAKRSLHTVICQVLEQ
ncbi:hypothetical protein [Dolichospermum sp. UHCC 0259]|nr:hypothetical protein [Dolichospermum sp. UHCC 0259]